MSVGDELVGPEDQTSSTGDVKPSGDAGKVTITAKDLEGPITEILGPAFGEMGKVFQGMDQKLQALDAKIGSSEAGGEVEDKDIQDLLKDPKGVISAEVKEQLKGGDYSGLTEAVVADRVTQLTREAKTEIDEQFGPGTWEEEFQEEVDGIIKVYPLKLKAQQPGKAVESAVAQIMGQKFNSLSEKKVTNKSESGKGGGDYKGLSPGRRPPTAKPKLSEDEVALIEGMKRAGIEDVDEETWLKDREVGPTLADYRASLKKAGGNANAG